MSLFIAFTAGVFSFLSPCVLTLFPSYLSYITGITLKDFENSKNQNRVRKLTIIHSVLFILGFSVLFILMGSAINILGHALFKYKEIIRIIGGALIIFFGLFILGVFNIGFLNMEAKFNLKYKPKGYFGSFLMGIIFASGWTPCVGPILGSILILAGTKETIFKGMGLLTAYSLGMGIPFFVSSLLITSFLSHYKQMSKYVRVINIICGIFLVVVGLLLLVNRFNF